MRQIVIANLSSIENATDDPVGNNIRQKRGFSSDGIGKELIITRLKFSELKLELKLLKKIGDASVVARMKILPAIDIWR